MPLKTVRLTIHVFQKDDGSENIPDNPSGRGWLLNSVMGSANGKMENLAVMNLSTSSPYFSDSKIQYQVANIYFWQDTDLWSKGWRKSLSHGPDLYNFIMSQSIAYKNSSVHILIPGDYSADGYQAGGRACGIGCHDWAMIEDTYHWYQNSNHWFPANTIRHELGHNFNVYHSWLSDHCSDTPTHSNCYSGPSCSNNMMDYNASQAAITQCQLSRMHEYLENNSSIVISGLPNYELSGQISWTGGSTALNNLNFLPDPEFEVHIEAPGASIYSWTKTYGNGNWYTNGSGSQANIEIDPMEDHMTFKVITEANCHELEETYAFYHFPNLYKVYPNPIQNEIAISVNGEIFRQILTLQEKDFSKQVHTLRIYNQFNVLVHEGKLESNIGTYTIDASGFRSGLYIVELRNVIFNKRYKVQKL